MSKRKKTIDLSGNGDAQALLRCGIGDFVTLQVGAAAITVEVVKLERAAIK